MSSRNPPDEAGTTLEAPAAFCLFDTEEFILVYIKLDINVFMLSHFNQ